MESVDLELEAIGLSVEGISAYLENRSIVSSENRAVDIRDFIRSNEVIRKMVQVPIHLDILCYAWDELQGTEAPAAIALDIAKKKTPTVTTLYEAIVHKLWRRDIPKLGKTDHREQLSPELANFVRDPIRLERVVKVENDILEELAIGLIEKNWVGFTDRDVNDLIRGREGGGEVTIPLSLERNLTKLSFLRSNSSRYHSYIFAHLTFKEFFAARYLTRDHDRLKTHLRKHKYNPQYQIVWRFVAGLLRDPGQLGNFFDLLEAEPRDLVGTQHVHLVMYCLSECRERLASDRRDSMYRMLADWLKLEIDVDKPCSIGIFMEFPENILWTQLSDRLSRDYILWAFRGRRALSTESSLNLISLFGYPDNSQIALGAFRGKGSLSPETIQSLMDLWQSGRQGSGSFVTNLRRQQHNLPRDQIEVLTKHLQNTKLRHAASRILAGQRTLPHTTIKILCDMLMSQDRGRRSVATIALAHRSDVLEETIDFLVDSVEEDSYSISSHPVSFLRHRKGLPKRAVDKLLSRIQRAVDGEAVHLAHHGVVAILSYQDLQGEDWELQHVAIKTLLRQPSFIRAGSRAAKLFPESPVGDGAGTPRPPPFA